MIEKKYYTGENTRLCVITGEKNRGGELMRLKSYKTPGNILFISFFFILIKANSA